MNGNRPHAIGDAPIEDRFYEQMNAIANALDDIFNPDWRSRGRATGFVLLVFPFNEHKGRANYISNADRKDMVAMLKEQLAYFEGMPSGEGHG